jgi:DNA repair photolyase
MTKEVLEHAIGSRLKVRNRKFSREGCDCLIGNDIGAYNTCSHGCIYCYANHDRKTVMYNMMIHNTNSPFLIGVEMAGDVIKDARQGRYIDGQMKLF